MRIGVLGAGRMGAPIIAALLDARHAVAVFDPDPTRVAIAVESGADAAADPIALARSVDVLVTILPGASDVEPVLLGSAGGAIRSLRPGSLWLDLTSNDPRVAARVAAVAAEHGVEAVGAPMTGGVAAAESRALGFFVGGEPAAVERARPLLAALASEGGIHVAGPAIGDGYTAKLLANLLWFGQVIAVSEALLLGQSLGLAPKPLSEMLTNSAGGSAFLEQYAPALLAGDYLESFGIDRVVEELEILTELAAEGAVPFELSSLVARLHREALERFGPVPGELLAAKLLEERARSQLST